MAKTGNKRLKTIYQMLSNDDDARACLQIPENACRAQPVNYLLFLLAVGCSQISDKLASTKLVLPWLFSTAGIPSFFSGLLVPIRESGSMLPQLYIGAWVRQFPRRKWFLVASTLAQALCLLSIIPVALWMQGAAAGWAIIGIISLFSLARSFSSVASKDVLGKTVDKTKRGQVSGYAATIAGITGIVIGLSLAWGFTLETVHILWLLVAAAFTFSVASVLYGLIREYKGATEGARSGKHEFKRAIDLMKNDVPFRHFVITRALMLSSALATPYIVLLAEQSHSSWFGLGIFLALSGLASALSSVFWGNQSDHNSRGVLTYTAVITTFICLSATGINWLPEASHAYLYGFLFFALSVTHQGVRLARKTYVVDLAEGNQRTTYVTVSNTIMGVLLLVVGIISALLSQLSITVALLFFAAISLLAAVMSRTMKEV